MHILNRIVVALVLMVAFLPLIAAQALESVDDRYKKQEALYQALDMVSVHYQSKQGVSAVQNRSGRDLEEAEERIPALARQKREVRLQLSAVIHTLRSLKEDHGIDLADEEQIRELLAYGEDQLRSTIRFLHVRGISNKTEDANVILRSYLVSSLGERTEQMMRERAMLHSRARLLGMISTAYQFEELEQKLRVQHEELIENYLVLLEKSEVAEQRMHASASREEEIKRIVAEVEGEILKMQFELARIDARIQRKTERDLIEKGIITSREGSYNDGKIVGNAAALVWPVGGRVTAGFMDSSYRSYFGFNHKGIDLAAPQGTPIRSVADGVVFLARDGGRTGYSYILVGHRGGTATLYGHISQISVTTGQDIGRGQIIGLSGGTPGTYGAGPMTTGAHVHFEVIQGGEHVDPLTVLPAR